mmetsp:Transcript_2562/g.3417  ORF Transcript_2562/g.3417 Transcript_2562/m.3417 type:complete len:105 (-) Transcript_2562:300-614(-)
MKDHTEALLIEYNPNLISYEQILLEWSEQHYVLLPPLKPQYKSAIWVKDAQEFDVAHNVIKKVMREKGADEIFVEVDVASVFYKAEEYHQHYLNKKRFGEVFLP